jgi:hypothetical protein
MRQWRVVIHQTCGMGWETRGGGGRGVRERHLRGRWRWRWRAGHDHDLLRDKELDVLLLVFQVEHLSRPTEGAYLLGKVF